MGKHRREKRNACIGKKQYTSLEEANIAAGITKRRGGYKRLWFNAYKCKFCGGYHIGRTGNYRL